MLKEFTWAGMLFKLRPAPALDTIDANAGMPQVMRLINQFGQNGSWVPATTVLSDPIVDDDFKRTMTAAIVADEPTK